MWVDPSNAAQLSYWDGPGGAYWAKRALRFDRCVAEHGNQLLKAADLDPNEAVLDIGCGTGEMTRWAGEQAERVLGVDLAGEMIEYARRRTAHEGLQNVKYLRADAQVHRFEAEFDVVLSRFGAMFFGVPYVAFTNIRRALRPGGRIVLLSWQPVERNEWQMIIRAALSVPPPGPTLAGSLTDPALVDALLTTAGFTDVHATPLAAPMYIGADADDAFDFVTGQHAARLDAFTPKERTRALDALRTAMATHQTCHGVLLDSAAWLIEASSP